MNYLISKFIDDELDLDEKVGFVDRVHADRSFKDESIDLLKMEKIIRADVVDRLPPIKMALKPKRFAGGMRSMGLWLAGAAAAALIAFFFFYPPGGDVTPAGDSTATHRFVIYRPDVKNAEIAGTFSDWQRIPMNRIGASGYWETTISIPYGEHRFTYILDGNIRFADPTVAAREQDDFGGQNSIISVESRT